MRFASSTVKSAQLCLNKSASKSAIPKLLKRDARTRAQQSAWKTWEATKTPSGLTGIFRQEGGVLLLQGCRRAACGG